MAQLNPHQLAESLRGGLQPLYIIHGEEDLLRVEALDHIRAAAREHGYLNREVITVDAKFDWSELRAASQSVGLFAELKLLEVHIPGGKPGKEGGEALQELADRLPEDTCVLILLPKLERAQTQGKWFGALARHGSVVEA